jgi:hypothetical protein
MPKLPEPTGDEGAIGQHLILGLTVTRFTDRCIATREMCLR